MGLVVAGLIGLGPVWAGSLLLKDFKPKSMLHTKEHRIEQAAFPVFDVHTHINDSRDRLVMDPKKLIQYMDQRNIQLMVILTGGFGEKLQAVIDRSVKPYPGRFVAFTELDWSQIDQEDFGSRMANLLEDSHRRGARGLKLLKNFGLGVMHKGQLLKIDDPIMDPIWKKCGELGFPVAIHVGDPEAFFQPIDASNERIEELGEHPDWAFNDRAKYPTFEQIHEALERVFARFPKTKFVSLHMGNWAENLDHVDEVLKKYKNVSVEFGGRQAELGRQPRRTREFFLKYQDRVMFGTDGYPEDEMYLNYFRWLETNDEYFDYAYSPAQGRWKIYGVGLPRSVLKKIYQTNAQKILAFKGASP